MASAPRESVLVKRCNRCGKVGTVDEFVRSPQCKDGYRPRCKECAHSTEKEYRDNNAELLSVRREEKRAHRKINDAYIPPAELACVKCGAMKPLSGYAPSRSNGSGHPRKKRMCKECVSARQREYRNNNKDRYIAYMAEYRRAHYDRLQEQSHENYMANREKRIKDAVEYSRNHPEICKNKRTREPEKAKCWSSFSDAVYRGLVQRRNVCDLCGSSGKIHGHHPDYSKPLDVIWVCTICHGKLHRGRRK